MNIDNSLKEVDLQIAQITLNVYRRLHQLDASSALQETKEQVDKLGSSKLIDDSRLEILYDVSDKCFEFWAPFCEMVISTYRDIQNHILPQLRQILSTEHLEMVENEIKENNFIIYDFNALKYLPDQEFEKEMSKLDQVDDMDRSDYDDDKEDYTYEDGPYCSACQERPCMCSDPEQTSTTW